MRQRPHLEKDAPENTAVCWECPLGLTRMSWHRPQKGPHERLQEQAACWEIGQPSPFRYALNILCAKFCQVMLQITLQLQLAFRLKLNQGPDFVLRHTSAGIHKECVVKSCKAEVEHVFLEIAVAK